MYKDLLPAGTVVKLANAEKLVMIGGYFTETENNRGVVYDYSGFPFPEGFAANDQVLAFNREAIEKVIVMGYEDEEQLELLQRLTDKEEDIRAAAKATAEGGSEVSDNE